MARLRERIREPVGDVVGTGEVFRATGDGPRRANGFKMLDVVDADQCHLIFSWNWRIEAKLDLDETFGRAFRAGNLIHPEAPRMNKNSSSLRTLLPSPLRSHCAIALKKCRKCPRQESGGCDFETSCILSPFRALTLRATHRRLGRT